MIRFTVTWLSLYVLSACLGRSFHSRNGRAIASCFALALMFSPLLLADMPVISRAVFAFLGVEFLFKVLDYARQHTGTRPDEKWFSRYLLFLLPYPSLSVVFGDTKRKAPDFRGLLWMFGSACGVGLVLFAMPRLAEIRLLQESFWIDHLSKVLLFAIFVESLAMGVYGLELAVGVAGRRPMHGILLSLTPAEFWWRYNTRVQAWFRLNVFGPCGGVRRPLRAIVCTFLVSALVHEVMFATATARLDGYQFLFFIVQAPAVAVSPTLARFARRGMLHQVLVRSLTIAWFVLTSIFFFHGFHRVFPTFYVAPQFLP